MGGNALLDVEGLDANGFLGAAVDIGGNAALLELFAFVSLFSSFFVNEPNGLGAVADIGGNAAPLDAGLDDENGFLGAAVDIGGNAALLEFFSVLASSFFVDIPKGDGAFFDIGGNAAPLDAGLDDENGFLGAAVDIGGNAAPLELLLDALFSSFFVKALNGDGALFDMGGKAALLVGAEQIDTLLSSFFVNAAKGDGADFDMGGNALLKGLSSFVLLSSFLENAPNGDGAFFDIGGNAAPLDAGLDDENGFLGAALDIGGKAALELFSVVFLSSFFVKAPNGLGAVADMGGNAAPLDAGLDDEKGFFGAAAAIGGNAAPLDEVGAFSVGLVSSFFVDTPKGVGAFDIGGKALLLVAFFGANGFLGAEADMGG